MTIPLTRDKTFLAAAIYLAALFASLIVLWGFLLIGGNPMTVQSTVSLDSSGIESALFKSGDAVTIKRLICSKRQVTIEHFPALNDSGGNWHPLRGGAITLGAGCGEVSHLFVMPDLQSGPYEYTSTIKFQTNLVGRDESVEFPPVSLTVFR